MVKCPIIGSFKAGRSGLAYEDHTEFPAVEREDMNGTRHFVLQVFGDSMTGEGIMPGDLALAREQSEVSSGELAVVLVEDPELEGRIKRVYFSGDSIILQSSNSAYPSQIFSGRGRAKIRIVGKAKKTFRDY